MKCENCRHWNRLNNTGLQAEKIGFGECDVIEFGERLAGEAMHKAGRKATLDERQRAGDDALTRSKAFVMDAEGQHAALYSAPDFGCVLYAAR